MVKEGERKGSWLLTCRTRSLMKLQRGFKETRAREGGRWRLRTCSCRQIVLIVGTPQRPAVEALETLETLEALKTQSSPVQCQ